MLYNTTTIWKASIASENIKFPWGRWPDWITKHVQSMALDDKKIKESRSKQTKMTRKHRQHRSCNLGVQRPTVRRSSGNQRLSTGMRTTTLAGKPGGLVEHGLRRNIPWLWLQWKTPQSCCAPNVKPGPRDGLLFLRKPWNTLTLGQPMLTLCRQRTAQSALLKMVPRGPSNDTRFPLMLLAAMPPLASAIRKDVCMSLGPWIFLWTPITWLYYLTSRKYLGVQVFKLHPRTLHWLTKEIAALCNVLSHGSYMEATAWVTELLQGENTKR